jgi:hypothetical protein
MRPSVLHATIEVYDTQASLLHEYTAQNNQATEVT